MLVVLPVRWRRISNLSIAQRSPTPSAPAQRIDPVDQSSINAAAHRLLYMMPVARNLTNLAEVQMQPWVVAVTVYQGLCNPRWRSCDWRLIRACDPCRGINTRLTSSLILLPLNIKQITTNNLQAVAAAQASSATRTMPLFSGSLPPLLPQQIISTPLGSKKPVGLNSTKLYTSKPSS